mmetsp:Transcript_17178/g.35277  ORF Transcript_17178/g.35277 Transcript_17178/m.35277 type:complete len:452 (-) Transcript_17178:415-1770(-)
MYGTMAEKPASQPLLRKSRYRRDTLGAKAKNFPHVQNQISSVLMTVVAKRGSITTNSPTTNSPTMQPKPKSFLYSMLNPRSNDFQAVAFKWFITIVIIMDLLLFIVSTDPDLNPQRAELCVVWEGIVSWIFLTEYLLRLVAVIESKKHGTMGPVKGRLRYMLTTHALIDLTATAPYFVEKFSGLNLPTLTYLRSFRLLRILKTQGFAKAINSVCRVIRFNSEILFVAVWIGMGLVLFTAVLMYYLRPRDEDHPEFESLSATMYLATMMLTGQGGPDGDLPWYTSSVVLLTGVFSIGMFAIPASMLTWGFEGEAERLAKLRWKKSMDNLRDDTSQTEDSGHDDWSYSSDEYSSDEEYLNVIAGLDDDDSDEEQEKIRKAFQLADTDGSGRLSLSEFTMMMNDNQNEALDETFGKYRVILAQRIQDLENKVEGNSKKLDRICELLEDMKRSQQ